MSSSCNLISHKLLLSEIQTPKDAPCLGQDQSQLGILQNAWEAACPVIRVALAEGILQDGRAAGKLLLEAPPQI